jgi:hypothetical protein
MAYQSMIEDVKIWHKVETLIKGNGFKWLYSKMIDNYNYISNEKAKVEKIHRMIIRNKLKRASLRRK